MTKSVESLNARISLTEGGGTLSDLLAQQKRLAFSTMVDYLDQLSEAIDLAHEQGFIHRSLNPSTILLTDEGHLVILGLRSTGGRKYSRETRGTSYEDSRLMRVAYMAPEQILMGSILSPAARHVSNIPGVDRTVDGRADLYSLGVILYHMVTGVLPFQAETLERMALMHLRMPPPSPRQFRPDLPLAAEQAMMRALAKRPSDRYVRAQDLATAFSVALIAAGQLDGYPYAESESFSEANRSTVIPSPSQLSGQALSERPVIPNESPVILRENAVILSDRAVILSESEGSLAKDSDPSPSFGMTAQASDDEDQPTNPVPAVHATPSSSTADAITPITPLSFASPVGAEASRSEAEYVANLRPWPSTSSEVSPTHTSVQPTDVPVGYNPTSPLPATSTTGALSLSNLQQGNTGTLKLTGPAKIVQVPVAGQPGLYVTGLLPVFPQQSTPGASAATLQGDPSREPIDRAPRSGAKWSVLQSFLPIAGVSAKRRGRLIAPTADLSAKARTILTLAVVVMFVVCGSGLFWFIHTHTVGAPSGAQQSASQSFATVTVTPDVTANANVILIDPLSQNIHNWPVATTGSIIYVFENGTYHIIDNNPTQGAPAILPDEILSGSFAYTLTMEEIKGDDTSINNEFGMIVRASSHNQNGKIITTFYSFEVLNTKNGEYQFWKYDSSSGASAGPWTKLWHQPIGKEFHQGHGSGSINTFKIFVNGKNFTLIVNGKQIATVQDTSCKGCPCTCSGGIGMWVNLKGTEVAFSSLRLTHM